MSQVMVDDVAVDSSEGLRTLQIHGLRAGQTVVVDAQVEPAAEVTAVETSYDPALAGGWTAPGEEVSLMQPAMKVVITARR